MVSVMPAAGRRPPLGRQGGKRGPESADATAPVQSEHVYFLVKPTIFNIVKLLFFASQTNNKDT